MNTRRVVEILRNEYVCAEREDCDRACCARCDLVMDRDDVLTALRVAIEKVCEPRLEAPAGVAFPSGPAPASRWISVDEALPMMQANGEKGCIVYNGKQVMFLIYERATVRGKTVYRWKYPWNRIYDYPKITHWMPLPKPPAGKEE